MAIHSNHQPRGLTLVECLIALTILSFAVMAVSFAGAAGQQQADYADNAARAIRLTRDLSEEILSKPYTDPGGSAVFGPDPGEATRAAFDDADDYHNYAEAAGQLKDFTGAAYPVADQAFSRSVTVAAGGQVVPALGVTVPGVTVTIRVQKPGGVKCEISRFIPAP